ncbi:MAG: VanZ family protein [Planctomycetota bacterium]
MRLWHRVPRPLRSLVPIAGMATLWWSSSCQLGTAPVAAAEALLHNGAHVVAYAALGSAFWLAWSASSRRQHDGSLGEGGGWLRRSWAAFFLAALYGAIDELHQSYVPGRVCSIVDLGSDAFGAAFAVLVLRGVSGRRARVPLAAWLCLLGGIGTSAFETYAG